MTSEIEKAILDSTEPILISDEKAQEIIMKANGEKVILLNKNEIDNWIGPININEYPINKDPSPIIVNKKAKPIETKQHVSVKYLEPHGLQPPGEIIIQQEANKLPPMAPPLIIRQIPVAPYEPETLIIRELPPEPPQPPPKKIITIAGRLLPPPPRKVIIEKMPEMPEKRPDIILERWLPYKDVPRKITLVPKPSEVEEPCNKENSERKYSVQAPIFINPPQALPYNPNNHNHNHNHNHFQSNFVMSQKNLSNPLNLAQDNNHSQAQHHHQYQQQQQQHQQILQQHQQQRQQQSNSNYNEKQKQIQQNNQKLTALLNQTFSMQQSLQNSAALSSLPPGISPLPTLSNFSLLQQSTLPSSMLSSHLQSAFSNPSMFHSPSQSSFVGSHFFQSNYLQNNFYSNNFSGYFPPKKMNNFGANYYNPYLQSASKNNF